MNTMLISSPFSSTDHNKMGSNWAGLDKSVFPQQPGVSRSYLKALRNCKLRHKLHRTWTHSDDETVNWQLKSSRQQKAPRSEPSSADMSGLKRHRDGKIAGLYDLDKTLGRGHFAVVKLARHVFTGEKVSLAIFVRKEWNVLIENQRAS